MTSERSQPNKAPSILHIGPGAFHRAHQALYADAMIRAGHPEAGIRAICLFPPHLSATHAAQDGRYHVLLREESGERLHQVESLYEVLDTATDDMLCDPALQLVTMTLTEKGYCHVPGTQRLDDDAISGDLATPDSPVSAIGWLALALDRRRRAGLPGITLASCDNVPANGRLLEAVMREFVARTRPELSDWMTQNVTFPVSMVDRIVPRVDEEAGAAIAALVGQPDALGVAAEPFSQWVLERRLAGPIPPLETVGVQIVEDVAPYELMKHRILNGAQTALAHIGVLSGFSTSAEAAADPVLAKWLSHFVFAQAETLICPAGEDLEAYARLTLARLRNPHIRHRLTQIGTDSSFKLGQRIVEAAVCHLDHADHRDLYALIIAAWIQYNTGRDAAGRAIPIDDPLAARFAEITAGANGDSTQLAEGFLALDLFAGPLRRHRGFLARVVSMLSSLKSETPRALIARTSADRGEDTIC
ncbi:mannitol dehydrogenase family protein [Ciceribacter sp. L1K23]|uniref:mannitol dehydrogenase family protein n=1 Tax=Ciceribacter sp. L1K23 TaxID=2820276 RepID=UPI001B82C981|nr:mannitol dehydrogenase family protein [Ciceribacter sp. L1K23]MBR0554384.1 mannitol dehydrogenase family protein [Ciceribacter sp. L1K23]